MIPGRLDRLVYLGVSETTEEQIPILQALTRNFQLADDVNLQEIAEQCYKTFTGADFYALCSDALLNAVKEKIAVLEKDPNSDDESLLVKQEHFLTALRFITPSVSAAELKRYKQIQDQYRTSKSK